MYVRECGRREYVCTSILLLPIFFKIEWANVHVLKKTLFVDEFKDLLQKCRNSKTNKIRFMDLWWCFLLFTTLLRVSCLMTRSWKNSSWKLGLKRTGKEPTFSWACKLDVHVNPEWIREVFFVWRSRLLSHRITIILGFREKSAHWMFITFFKAGDTKTKKSYYFVLSENSLKARYYVGRFMTKFLRIYAQTMWSGEQ